MTTNYKPSGFFRRSLDAFIDARQRQANAIVAAQLLKMDEATLTSHGYDRRELQRRARSF